MIGHLVSEWAMDDWLRQELLPADAIEEAGEHAVRFVARAFRCDEAFARRALGVLMRGDRALRASPAPMMCRAVLAMLVRRCEHRFGVYLGKTTRALGAVETALAGGSKTGAAWRSGRKPEATAAPIAAPASTSLG